MKKFLAFLISVIIIACLGIVFYQFAKNDEVINVNAQTVYINYGETLSLDDLGFSREEASKDTKIDFNAGGEEVTSIIKYDEATKCYVPTQKGGSTTIKISTTNRKYKTFAIDVVIGIGTEEYPYYISNETQLFDIGTKFNINSYFKLVQDINISKEHKPIGMYEEDGTWKYIEFTGHFDGGYNSINNLKITTCNYGGLFGILGDGSTVSNLEINNANINGEFIGVGTVAGICRGVINRVIVNNSTISNSRTSSYTGGIAGKLNTDETVALSTTASILRCGINSNSSITGYGYVGGIAGIMNSAKLQACYSKVSLTNNSNNPTGGLVGELTVDEVSYIRECYAVASMKVKNSSYTGNIVGLISLNSNTAISQITKNTVLMGNYYNNETNKYNNVGYDSYSFTTSSDYCAKGCTEIELKQKATYIYYVNSSKDIIYWENVWHIVDGEYPSLTYANKFIDVSTDPSNPTTPDTPDDPDIKNPDDGVDVSSIVISSKEDLVQHLQSKASVSGDYILSCNIDLGGMYWTPINFQGTFKSSSNSVYKISNFKINSTGKHLGFFSALGKANIQNIKFSNVTIESSCNSNTAGVLVGYIQGDTNISNVSVDIASIKSTSTYAGGLVGYTSNAIINISNVLINALSIDGKVNNVGGLVGYMSTNTTASSCETSAFGVGINAYKRAGGVTSTNYGLIKNCNFLGNINSLAQTSTDAYFGGITGVNYGTLSKCINNADISVNNTSSNHTYFVAGVCGYNFGKIYYCAVESYGAIKASDNSNLTYIAGLVGYNKGEVVKSGCRKTEIGSTSANTAGLVAYNYGGSVIGCETSSNLIGNYVAGLALYNGNNATIDSCYTGLNKTSRNTYKGKYISSIAYQVSSGTILDSMVNAKLECTHAKGYIVGFVANMPFTSNIYGTVKNCISNVSMSGVGTKYLDSLEENLLKASQTTGTIQNCLISEDAKVDGVIVSKYSTSNFLFWTIKTYAPGSKSNYAVISNSQLRSITTYYDTNLCVFNINSKESINSDSKWYFDNTTSLPIPRIVHDNINLYPQG